MPDPLKPYDLDLSIAQDAVLLESQDGEGGVWLVQVIKAGLNGRGDTVYTEESLREAAPLFEGVTVNGHGFPQVYNHLPEHIQKAYPGGFVNAVLGTLKEARYDEDRKAIMAKMVFAENDLVKAVKSTAVSLFKKLGEVKPFGFSINAAGSVLKESGLRIVQSFKRVTGLDLVTEPSAGGGFVTLLESLHPEQETKENKMDREKIVSLLESIGHKPEEFEGKTDEQLLEALSVALNKDTKTETKPDTKGAEVTALIESLTGKTKELDDILNTAKTEKAKRDAESWGETLKESMDGTSIGKAVQAFKDGVLAGLKAKFPERVEDMSGVTEYLKESAREWDKLSGEKRTYGDLKVGDTTEDKLVESLDKGMSGEIDFSFGHFVREQTGKAELTEESFQEAISTSDGTNVLARTMNRGLERAYNANSMDLSWLLDDVRVAPNFKTQEYNRIPGFALASSVTEGTAIPLVTAPTEAQITYSPSNYAQIAGITRQTVLADDIGYVNRLRLHLGDSLAKAHDNFFLNTVITDNPTLEDDSTALFHANHSNTGTTAMSVAQLLIANAAMLAQTHPGDATTLGWANRPAVMLIPTALVDEAMDIIIPPPGEATADTGWIGALFRDGVDRNAREGANLQTQWPMRVVLNLTTDDANDWFLFSSVANGAPDKVSATYVGSRTPEVIVQSNPQEGNAFAADIALSVKVRWGFGGEAVNYRGMWGGIVA